MTGPVLASRPRRGWTVTSRAVIATCLVAVVSVVITAAVALPIVLRSANQEARDTLAAKARVAANAIEGQQTPGGAAREEERAQRVAATLRADGVQVVLILDGRADQAGLPPRFVTTIAEGGTVSQPLFFRGTPMIAEGRPAGPGDGIVLLQATTTANVRTVISRLGLALLAGLGAGLLAGVVLARRLSRPLRQVAATARRLSAGDRSARAPTDAPAEVAAVSVALNDLAGALITSENRQRTFLLSISHELRTPLTTMKGYAEALADGVIGPDGAQRAGQTMLAESEHLDRLIEDLLVLARLEADDFPLEVLDVDLVSLATGVAESWAARCAAVGVELRTELPEPTAGPAAGPALGPAVGPAAGPAVVARTDPRRIRQVLDGLLENALRVAPQGAPVVLAVRPGGTGRDGPPEDPTLQPHAVLEVRDGGPGFTDDDLAVAFERGVLYEKYKGVRKVGSGLGLALAHRLVRRLGGRIEAGHAPEGGARITVRLPLGR